MKQHKSRKKIAFVVSNAIFFRHYLTTDALSILADQHDLIIVAEKSLEPLFQKSLQRFQVLFYKYPETVEKKVRLLNELSLFASKDLSRDFSFRILRKYNSSPHLRDGSLWANPTKLRFKSWVKRKLYEFLAKNGFLPNIVKGVQNVLAKESPIRKINDEQQFDLIICASNAGDTVDTDVADISNGETITKTLILVDNWDNLSSKYVMTFHPDKLAVWGEQSKLHAITIQKLQEKSVTVLGTPRFAGYYGEPVKSDLISSASIGLPKDYILVIGSQTFWDENTFLHKLREVVDEQFEAMTIVYRPHPWRETFGQTFHPPSGIMIDPTLKKLEVENVGELPALPKLALYRHLMEQASIIVGGCTSMIVEASILRKKYLLLAHDDGNPVQSPFERFRRTEHQNLTFCLSNVEICYHLDDLASKMNKLISRDIGNADIVLDQLISPKTQDYKFNLTQLVDEMCGVGPADKT